MGCFETSQTPVLFFISLKLLILHFDTNPLSFCHFSVNNSFRMGGCVASKLEEAQVVAICRERKRQLKLAVEKRYALAEAHCNYCQALYAVSAAIKLFVARHASPASPYLITFPPATGSPPPPPPPQSDHKVINNPIFLEKTPSESNQEAIACESCGSSTTSDSCDEGEEVEEEQVIREEQTCMYYNYMQMPQSVPSEQVVREEQACMFYNYMQTPPPPAMPSPQRDFGWDFFNPFDGARPEVISSYRRISDDELKAVREQEGIPELEEEEDREKEEKKAVMAEENVPKEAEKSEDGAVKEVDGANVSHGEPKGLTVIGSPEKGRELLEALKDIEDHFIRAYDSGKDVSRMLEVNNVHLLSNLEGIKGKNGFSSYGSVILSICSRHFYLHELYLRLRPFCMCPFAELHFKLPFS